MPAPAQPAGTGSPKAETFFDVIFESAVEGCIRAFLVLLLGSIAIGMVGDIFKDMTPTAPPGFGGKPELEAPAPGPQHHHAPTAHGNWSFVKHNQFALVASIFFVLGLRKRLICRGNTSNAPATRTHKVLNRFSEDWFSLIVGNAFGATISAFVLVWAQQWSWSQICWHWFLSQVLPAFRPVGRFLLGDTGAHRLQDLWAWYSGNQFRFTFWLLYFAAIANDLGLPNFKALGRWLGRRVRHRLQERRSARKPISGGAAE